jgi:cytochrome c-type biogenesis protein CcmE
VLRGQAKFVIGSGLIILAVFYLAYSGYEQNRADSYTVAALYAMKDSAYGRRLEVEGDVVAGSIRREGGVVDFVIGQGPQILRIRYVGKDAPDTLIDGATAFVTGTVGKDGIFVADSLLVMSKSKDEHG